MEFKEKTYFEVYLDDKLLLKGIGENVEFLGDNTIQQSKRGYFPYGYDKNSYINPEIPMCFVNYTTQDREILEGLENNSYEIIDLFKEKL